MNGEHGAHDTERGERVTMIFKKKKMQRERENEIKAAMARWEWDADNAGVMADRMVEMVKKGEMDQAEVTEIVKKGSAILKRITEICDDIRENGATDELIEEGEKATEELRRIFHLPDHGKYEDPRPIFPDKEG